MRTTNKPVVAIGVGPYGHPVIKPMEGFRKSVLIVGGSQTGKTRLANSIVGQQVSTLGGGNLTIDFKGGPELVRAKAELAEREGRTFLHFSLAPKTGGGYNPAHPYAPSVPARYDPLSRGNGESKTSMLLNSVPREGDAAAYLRAAREVAELAWNIAALTGFDQTLSADGKTRISSMDVLLEMLDPGKQGAGRLFQQTRALQVEQVRSLYPHLSIRDADSRIESLRARVSSIEAELKNRASVTAQAVISTRQLLSSYVNSSALYPNSLSTGKFPALQIDLVRAVLLGEVVVFSLPAQEYPDFSGMIGSMILLDLQNAVATLRNNVQKVARLYGLDVSSAGDIPWPAFLLQVEELGTAANEASARALIDLLNKSADVGIRGVVSTQALADIRAVDDGKGVWMDRLLAQVDHLFALQLNTPTDDEIVCGFSGKVIKQIAAAETQVQNNRWKLFTGARQSTALRGSDTELTRIPLGAAQELDRDRRQLVYVTKSPKLTAVHTTGAEGPNNWHEVIEMVPVHELPFNYDPFADAARAGLSRKEAIGKARELHKEIDDRGGVLAQILDNSHERADVGRKSIDTPVDASSSNDAPTVETAWDLNNSVLDEHVADGDGGDGGWDEFEKATPDAQWLTE